MASPLRIATLDDVVITRELLSRPLHNLNSRTELRAMHGLADLLPQGSQVVLQRLADLAVELCDAGTGGISMLETNADGSECFRWAALAGELASHVGGTTPRGWSPCGECLNAGKAMLYAYPGRFFSYFEQVSPVIVEGLVIPFYDAGVAIGTIWIVSHDRNRRFNAEDVRVMTSLGAFVAAALRLARRPDVDGGSQREVVWGELLRRIARGETAALEALMEETRPLVFARALKILSSPADAEEVASDVYARVWKTAARYELERCNVTGWLMTITRNRAIDQLRSRVSAQQRNENALCVMCSGVMDRETNAAYFDLRKDVRSALEGISEEQRRAIELAYFDGYSTAEIATQLGRPQGTVKTHIRSGLIALRRLVAAAEPLPAAR